MSSEDPKQGEPANDATPVSPDGVPEASPTAGEPASDAERVTHSPSVDNPYGTYDDAYGYDTSSKGTSETIPAVNPSVQRAAQIEEKTEKTPVKKAAGAPPAPPKPPKPPVDEEDGEEEGMLRMSFLEHLEELRSRILKALAGLVVAFILCLTFCDKLWVIIQQPAHSALVEIGAKNTDLVFTSPIESFQIIWMKLPLLCSVFLTSPWLLYQVWAFVAPGLYKKERRWAAPFILSSAGLFIAGGLFAYFLAFRYALVFLLGIGHGINVTPMITISEYFDLFVDVVLGIGVVFELPVIIFFLTLLRIASPQFLLSHSRYAILLITVLAAIITPTPDVFNMMLFAVPMVLLYFIGVFASYLLVLKRENRKFPWRAFFIWLAATILVIAIVFYVLVAKYHFKVVLSWPFLVR